MCSTPQAIKSHLHNRPKQHREYLLPKKPPRKLAKVKCENCRRAKKKCEMDPFDQRPGCQRCVEAGLLCPGLTKGRASTSINKTHRTPSPSIPPHSDSNPTNNMERNTNGLDLKLEQLKARACFVCRVSRITCIPVSNQYSPICWNCILAKQRNLLSSCLCMRDVPLTDVNIFLSCPTEAVESFPTKGPGFNLNNILLEFDVTWTLSNIITEVAAFLSSRSTEPTSKVGILSSPSFVQLIQHHIFPERATLFQAMLYGTSSSNRHPDQVLERLGISAGDRFLTCLNKELNSQPLFTLSVEKRQALFLLIFGTILAIGYTRRSCATGGHANMSQELWDPMRKFLCEILAHHLVLLGKSIGVEFDKDTEELILHHSLARWYQKGTHGWITSSPTKEDSRANIVSKNTGETRRDERVCKSFGRHQCRNFRTGTSRYCRGHSCALPKVTMDGFSGCVRPDFQDQSLRHLSGREMRRKFSFRAACETARFNSPNYQGGKPPIDPRLLETPKHVPLWEIQATPSIDLGTGLGRDVPWLPWEIDPWETDVDCDIVQRLDDGLEEDDITLVV